MNKRIQLNTIDLGGGTTKGCDCEAPDLSAYAKKEDVPKKVSELENDSNYVIQDNIKTINGESIFGSGNISVGGRLTLKQTITNNSINIDKGFENLINREFDKLMVDVELSSNATDVTFIASDINADNYQRELITVAELKRFTIIIDGTYYPNIKMDIFETPYSGYAKTEHLYSEWGLAGVVAISLANVPSTTTITKKYYY
jgi:hypothetical protein